MSHKCFEDYDCGSITFSNKNFFGLKTSGFILISNDFALSKRIEKETTTFIVSDHKKKGNLDLVLRLLKEEYGALSYEFYKSDGIGLKRFSENNVEYWNDTFRNHHPIMMFSIGVSLLKRLIEKDKNKNESCGL